MTRTFDRAAYNKVYYQEHTEARRAKARRYYWAHREKVLAARKAWAENHKPMIKALGKEYQRHERLQVLTYYSIADYPVCACCGITDIDVLCIDHINNNGAEQRKAMGWGRGAGTVLCHWLNRNGFPEGYQVLCWNCNHKKRLKDLED